MPEREQIERELRENRDQQLKLIESQLPEIGNCKFAEYFTAAIGPTLYNKFMANYTWKMWNIPGDELETSMVWADRFQSEKAAPTTQKVTGYDPLKFDDHTLGKGIRFQIYPKHGWNAVWDAMVARSTVVRDEIVGIRDEHKRAHVLTASGEKHYFSEYHTVFCSIDVDRLWGEDTLPYTGRMMIPLVIPGLERAFPENAESLHYWSCEFQTRVTEMKAVTRRESPRHADPDRGAGAALRGTVLSPKHDRVRSRKNLFAEKAYPQQSEEAFATYDSYISRGRKIPNLRYVGRHSEFNGRNARHTRRAALP